MAFVAVVSSGFGAVENAGAGHRTTACFDDGRIKRPIRISALRLLGKRMVHTGNLKRQDNEPALDKEPFRYASRF